MSTPGDPIPPRPLDPAGFAALKPITTTISGRFYRITSNDFPKSCLFYSKRGALRFDSPSSKWGVCYCATDIVGCFQEVHGDKLNHHGNIDFPVIAKSDVWEITLPELTVIPLFDKNLGKLRADLGCFIGGYALSQEWGRSLMEHPLGVDGVTYLARKAAVECAALFGDPVANSRPWQSAVIQNRLGPIVEWTGFRNMQTSLGFSITSRPPTLPSPTWGE